MNVTLNKQKRVSIFNDVELGLQVSALGAPKILLMAFLLSELFFLYDTNYLNWFKCINTQRVIRFKIYCKKFPTGQDRLLAYILWVYEFYSLLVALEIVIAIVRWCLARPGHHWVCGRKIEPCNSFKRLVKGCSGL